MPFPQKRHPSLQPLSREHHQALLLCWKLRQGFAKGIDAERIKKYADWFYTTYLLPHFHTEEKYLFPILGPNHPGVAKALKEHQRLNALFTQTGDTGHILRQIAFELEQHVRFEERELFNDIQQAASPGQWQQLEEMHQEEKFFENIEDRFWETEKS
ncbi:MAG: hemerythrin domain-containing protein [Chitinophagaceae bacterium]|nr:hemerythrin domain-containing protein [Chitinophagaceae bacterium]